jgi:hypothetical protein
MHTIAAITFAKQRRDGTEVEVDGDRNHTIGRHHDE